MACYLSEAAYYGRKTGIAHLRRHQGCRDLPKAGPVIPEEQAPGAVRGYRRMVVNPYIVFYRVTRVLPGLESVWVVPPYVTDTLAPSSAVTTTKPRATAEVLTFVAPVTDRPGPASVLIVPSAFSRIIVILSEDCPSRW